MSFQVTTIIQYNFRVTQVETYDGCLHPKIKYSLNINMKDGHGVSLSDNQWKYPYSE